jgi:hypothetical protein
MIKLQRYLLTALVLASMLINAADAKKVTFTNGEDSLSGHYLLPDTDKPRAVILFVHRDAPLENDAYGYDPLIWRRLQSQGFAIFS